MAETWDKLFRAVVLKANLLRADSATAMETAYTDPDIGAAQMIDKQNEFPKSAVDDALLAAGDRLVRAIGMHAKSPYRKDFADTIVFLTTGEKIPLIGNSTGHPIIGVLGDVRDVTDLTICEYTSRQQIDSYNQLSSSLKQALYFYNHDNTRFFHTRPVDGVEVDVVVWDKDAERIKMNTSPTRGNCNFTADLHETLINGALGILTRGTFNDAQATYWSGMFETSIKEVQMHGVVGVSSGNDGSTR